MGNSGTFSCKTSDRKVTWKYGCFTEEFYMTCAAVCDTGFAISLCGRLGLREQEEVLRLRQEREKRRKAKKLAGKSGADTPKRGK